MKKFVLALAAAALVATPAMARKPKERDNSNEIIAAMVIGGLIGAAIANKNNQQVREDDEIVYQPRRTEYRQYQAYDCRDHMEVIYRNGRRITYNVRTCN